jgi:hypothetical protein
MRPLGMNLAFPMLPASATSAWKPALGPSSRRAVTVSVPETTGHQGSLVPHSLPGNRQLAGLRSLRLPAARLPCSSPP